MPGLVTFSLALFLLIFGLIRGNPEGWGSPLILACLVGAAALLAAFIAIEARSDHPMLDLTLFRKPAFNGVSAVAFGLSAGMFAMFLYLTIYMQGVLDYSPLEAGLRFLPLTVLSFVASPIAGSLSHRIPIRVLLGARPHPGRGRAAADARRLRRLRRGRRCCAGFLLAGIGIGIANPGIGQAAIAVVPVEKAGHGVGDQHDLPPGRDRHRRRRARRGLPVAGRLEARRAAAERPARPRRTGLLGRLARRRRRSRRAGRRAEVVHAAKVAFVSGFNEIILIAAILSFVGAALGFLLVRSRDFVQPTDGPRGGPPPA